MKILIIENTFVNKLDDKGGVPAELGEVVDVPKDQAIELVKIGRALYTEQKDSHVKTGQFTATKEMLKAGEQAVKLREQERNPKPAAAPAAPPAGGGNGAGGGQG